MSLLRSYSRLSATLRSAVMHAAFDYFYGLSVVRCGSMDDLLRCLFMNDPLLASLYVQ